MYDTQYLWLGQIEMVWIWLIVLVVAGILALVLSLLGPRLRYLGRAVFSGLLAAAVGFGVSTAFDIRDANRAEIVTENAVYLSQNESPIPMISPLDYTVYHFYGIDNGQDIDVTVHDKRAEFFQGDRNLKEGHIYQIAYAEDPASELLAVEDTGKTIHDADSAVDVAVYYKFIDEDNGGPYGEYNVLYYGHDTHLLKTWVDEQRYFKKDGYQSSDFDSPDVVYPGIGDLSFVTPTLEEKGDYFLYRITATNLENPKNMEALSDIGFVTLEEPDESASNAFGWIEVLKDDGFKKVPKNQWGDLEIKDFVPEQPALESREENVETTTSVKPKTETETTKYTRRRFIQKL